jgi:hypothetical protein
VRASLGRRRAALLAGGAAVVLGGWFTASAVIAGHGWYHTRLGHGVPWLPVAVVGFLGLLLALTDLISALTLGALTAYHLINVTPSGAPISELPLALIPTAAVPLLFALHITSVSALVRAPRTPLPATAPLAAAAK